ncbi:PHD finger protein ING1 [Telopea speciosissima]|uniref:PHD finger protein ING1 n=1 Tax=Telopea speciosissima TaxID=54955 RepID=UPI001CC471ED|nr:PHD finger protein ING1 [Telopea speciosissima]XP_043703350.1 PHD finger protein ING1 [Telopea speciosissima]XP_043703351.1 PHD finger protein ING1 [Telopea speciosissima]XP_043703352.1 PHD finger protein ING1 [Telopea speciosissima]XP_043703353.1 PHD finger protein ING1 [Telopea speciosissima]XP_043703354.1 PHD finger protein ING1 [Telopea speciosissima]XP_043703355.1 PHD finger protein ING1 [Telopea speciosissima]
MSFLEDFQASLESLPTILQRKYSLMCDLDKSLQESQRQNELRCEQEIEDIKRGVQSGNITPDTSLIRFSDDALDEQKHCIRIADEKVGLAIQAYDLVDAHVQQLDQYMKRLDEELRRERDLAGAGGVAALNSDINVKSGRGSETSKGGRKKTRSAAAATVAADPPSMDLDLPVDPNEPTYCYCNQISFGEMIACDNPDCKIEWFHYGCVGLKDPPKGKWYCPDCASTKRRKGK